jgi:thiol:disulfide interchange protein DsbD
MVPALARVLPKPGPWMDTFRQVMAFPLYLTVVWLVWVFANQTGPDGMAALLVGLVALSFALWLAARPTANRPNAWPAHTATAAAIVVSLAALAGAARMQAGSNKTPSEDFTPFTSERLAEIKADPDQAAFVNMTADWCVTCLVNERVALATEPVRSAFRERGVVYLKGDWTRRDTEITRYLEQYGRNGVPLYVFYPADNPTNPVVLPQILTPGTVLEFLD